MEAAPGEPVDGVEPPHVPYKEAQYLTPEDSRRVVAALAGHEFELPILVGLSCGLRPAEYLALRWRDLDLDGCGLRVVQNVHRVRSDQVHEHMGCKVQGFRFGPAKTHRSRRPVSVPPALIDRMARWGDVQTAARAQAGDAWTDLDLVFTDARGYPHSEERVRLSFYKLLKQTGLQRVVLYSLRHTMATLVLADSKDLKLVASRLGHTSEHLVLKTYQHLLPGADRAAADRLGRFLSGDDDGR